MKIISTSLLFGVLLFAACGRKSAADTTAASAPAPAPAPASVPASMPESAPAMPATRASVEARIDQWKLHPAEMEDEMTHDHRVVRMRPPTEPLPEYSKAEALEAYITRRLAADPVLANTHFTVGVERVVATLTGTAASMEQIGRAMAVVLDTEGISEVVSELVLPEASAAAAEGTAAAIPHG